VGVRRRLDRLEGGKAPCRACGIAPSLPSVYEVDWELGSTGGSSPPCPRCGQRARVAVEWPGLEAQTVTGGRG
jgi:hypothetical protein